MTIRLKIPEMETEQGPVYKEEKWSEPHYHLWSCGCRTRIKKDAFIIMPCSENCHILKAVLEEGKNNEPKTEICS